MNILLKIKLIRLFIILLPLILFATCESMLETEPENSKIRDEYWKIRDDVESATIGAYDAVQWCVWTFFVWGEVRGDLVFVDIGSNSLVNMNRQIIDQDNSECKWDRIYSAINKINTVIRYAPLAEENDNTFSKEELNTYLAECLTLRALCYFYLVRTYLEFPYITTPSDNDEQDYAVKPTSNEAVLDSIISDLHKALNMVRNDFSDYPHLEKNQDIRKAYEKGRVTKPFIWALLADAYLTENEYELVVSYSDSIINFTNPSFFYPNFALVTGTSWMSNFFPGNSSESIFELQYTNTYDDAGELAEWFTSEFGSGSVRFENKINPNTNTLRYWEGDNFAQPVTKDMRGSNGTFDANNKTSIWKWAGKNRNGGSANARDLTSNDANWIVYRLADIILMKAEALNRLGRMDDAITALRLVRKRAGFLAEKIEAGSVEALEEIILDERARELAVEGKRWFDLVRIAKRQNNYAIIADRIADAWAYPNAQGAWRAKVYNPLSWYLPVHRSELDLNKMLTQNSYYNETK